MNLLFATLLLALAQRSSTMTTCADRGWVVSTGEFYWQEPGVTRGLRNIGTTRIEMLKFEIK